MWSMSGKIWIKFWPYLAYWDGSKINWQKRYWSRSSSVAVRLWTIPFLTQFISYFYFFPRFFSPCFFLSFSLVNKNIWGSRPRSVSSRARSTTTSLHSFLFSIPPRYLFPNKKNKTNTTSELNTCGIIINGRQKQKEKYKVQQQTHSLSIRSRRLRWASSNTSTGWNRPLLPGQVLALTWAWASWPQSSRQ